MRGAVKTVKDINLLPEEIKDTEYIQPSRGGNTTAKILVGLIIGVVIIAVTLAVPFAYIRQKEKELESIKNEIESDKYAEVREVNAELDSIVEELASKADVIDTIDESSTPLAEVIVALQGAIPEGVALTQIDYTSNRLSVMGIAPDRIAVAELVASIERISLLNLSADVNVEDGTNIFNLSLIVGRGGS